MGFGRVGGGACARARRTIKVKPWKVGPFLVLMVAAAGCNHPEEKFGRTWYLDGAGNWGFGVSEMVYGLREAGYKGQVSAFLWSLTMSPVADQVLKPLSGLGAARLAGCIDDYLRRHPGREVNIIGLSAGAGVALRAVEHMTPPHKINNMVLLAASVSSQYDVKPVLKNMRGKIYIYYSQNDAMLAGPVRVFGAFGGKLGDEPAGLCGLHAVGSRDRVVNIAWRPRFERYGWYGSHTSCTSEAFVRHVLSAHIITESTRGPALASATPTRTKSPSVRPKLTGGRVANAARRPGGSSVRPSQLKPTSNTPRARPSQPVKPTRPVYAPPSDDLVAAGAQAPKARPGKPTTFLTLSRRDPRFPSRSRLTGGVQVRLVGVPSATVAKVQVRLDRNDPPAVHDMVLNRQRRYRGINGRSWAVTLLRVHAPSQTAWLQIQPGGGPGRQAARTRNTHTLTS